MKKLRLILFICFISIISVMAVSNKDRILLLLEDYEEVCTKYQYIVTAEPRTNCITTSCLKDYTHNYIKTNNCTEYQLIRKTNIEPFIYDFDWCKVYPNSEKCKQKQPLCTPSGNDEKVGCLVVGNITKFTKIVLHSDYYI